MRLWSMPFWRVVGIIRCVYLGVVGFARMPWRVRSLSSLISFISCISLLHSCLFFFRLYITSSFSYYIILSLYFLRCSGSSGSSPFLTLRFGVLLSFLLLLFIMLSRTELFLFS